MSTIPVVFNNTVLRDGHQSLAATRMTTQQMETVAPELDTLGFGSLETWGGATIDAGVRYRVWSPESPRVEVEIFEGHTELARRIDA